MSWKWVLWQRIFLKIKVYIGERETDKLACAIKIMEKTKSTHKVMKLIKINICMMPSLLK
jgi:hypothetical protein